MILTDAERCSAVVAGTLHLLEEWARKDNLEDRDLAKVMLEFYPAMGEQDFSYLDDLLRDSLWDKTEEIRRIPIAERSEDQDSRLALLMSIIQFVDADNPEEWSDPESVHFLKPEKVDLEPA